MNKEDELDVAGLRECPDCHEAIDVSDRNWVGGRCKSCAEKQLDYIDQTVAECDMEIAQIRSEHLQAMQSAFNAGMTHMKSSNWNKITPDEAFRRWLHERTQENNLAVLTPRAAKDGGAL